MILFSFVFFFIFFFNDPATTEIYTLSLHDALPILGGRVGLDARRLDGERARASSIRVGVGAPPCRTPRRTQLHGPRMRRGRSEEHTSELQSQSNLVCRLLLEKKKKKKQDTNLGEGN